jgi:hypothetical protein
MGVTEERFRKRIGKKARKGFRGWPMATIAFYGPNLIRASKIAVSIFRFEGDEDGDMRAWLSDDGDIRHDPVISQEILEFIQRHDAKSVAITDGIIGCPHQEGIDYEGEWCPVCEFWKGRDRFTGELLP